MEQTDTSMKRVHIKWLIAILIAVIFFIAGYATSQMMRGHGPMNGRAPSGMNGGRGYGDRQNTDMRPGAPAAESDTAPQIQVEAQ